jgi:hypothetical protein
MLLSTSEAVEFAGRLPQCLGNMATSTCQIRFAPEYGCNLQRDYMAACRRGFNNIKAKFSRMPTTGKTFMSWYDSEYNFYTAIACLFGPNGGDIPVFDAGPSATVSKLKFDAGSAVLKLASLSLPSANAPTPSGPDITPAPACKAVIRASHWHANDEFRDGQELPEQLQAPGLDMSNVNAVLRRKGDIARAPVIEASPENSGLPRVTFDDLPDGWIGMELGKIEDQQMPGAILPRALVLYVAPSGPAAKVGIQRGDYILRLGGRSIDDAMYLGLHMTEAPIGTPMNVTYQRDGRSTTTSVVAIDIDQAARENDVSALRYLGDYHANRSASAPESPAPHNYYQRAVNRRRPLDGAIARIDAAATSRPTRRRHGSGTKWRPTRIMCRKCGAWPTCTREGKADRGTWLARAHGWRRALPAATSNRCMKLSGCFARRARRSCRTSAGGSNGSSPRRPRQFQRTAAEQSTRRASTFRSSSSMASVA